MTSRTSYAALAGLALLLLVLALVLTGFAEVRECEQKGGYWNEMDDRCVMTR